MLCCWPRQAVPQVYFCVPPELGHLESVCIVCELSGLQLTCVTRRDPVVKHFQNLIPARKRPCRRDITDPVFPLHM